jgi:hypothetical protein
MTAQIPDPVSVGNVEVETPNQVIMPVGASRYLQQAHPGYSYQNPLAFRNRILTDNGFRSKYIDDVISWETKDDPEIQQKIQENPEFLEETRRLTEASVLNELYKEVTTGEEVFDTIANRGAYFAGKEFDQARIPDYVRTVMTFPEHYEQFSLTDGKKLTAPLQENVGLIGNLAQTDEAFRDQLYKDRFQLFLGALGQSHNRHGIDVNDPTKLAKGFAIFENYGGEGLTQYVNYFQNYDSTRPIQEQTPEVQRAHRFFDGVDTRGRKPSDVVGRFVGNPDSPDGVIQFNPAQLSAELGSDIPLDYNNFTKFFDSDESLNRMLSATAVRRIIPEGEGVVDVSPTMTESEMNEFKAFMDSGVGTEKSSKMLFDLMALARDGKGFTFDDLFASIAVHATPQQGERGAIEYVFNPEELPSTARVAYEALLLDHATNGSNSFRNAGEGMVAMEPERARRIQSQHSNRDFYRFVNTVKVPMYDDLGNVIAFREEYNPEFLSWRLDRPALMMGRIGQGLNDYVFTPMVQNTAKLFDFMGRDDIADKITSSDYFTQLREAGDFNPSEMTGGLFEGRGGGTLALTDLGGYILGAIAIGKAVTATGGLALAAGAGRAATAAASMRNLAMTGQFLKGGRDVTRFQAQAYKTAEILTNASKTHTSVLNAEIGAGVLEMAGGVRRSMVGNPFVDNIMNKIGVQTELERVYATSDNFTRIGLDFLSSVGVGLVFDTTWAGIKYAGNIARVARGKTARGLEWDNVAKDYVQRNEAVFAPEYKRFWHDMTNGLQEIPLGSVADTQANMFLGRSVFQNAENISSLHDAAGVMNRELGDYFSTVRADIEKTVRYWDEELGGKMRYTEDQINTRVDLLYQEFMDKIADGVVSVFRNQDPNKRDIVEFFAQTMKELAPTVRQVGKHEQSGTRYVLNEIDAHTLAAADPNRVVRETMQDNNVVRYTVHEVDEGFWGSQLSDAIMKRYTKPTVSEVIDTNVRRLGLDPENLSPEQLKVTTAIRAHAEKVLNQPVMVGNQRGYVTDYNATSAVTLRPGVKPKDPAAIAVPQSYTVRTMDGKLHKDLPVEQVRFLQEPSVQPRMAPIQETAARQSVDNYAAAMGRVADPDREIREGVIRELRETDQRAVTFDLNSGIPQGSVLARARDLGVPETQVREIIGEVFDKPIQAARKAIEQINASKRIKRPKTRERKIAEQEQVIATAQRKKEQAQDVLTEFYGGDVRGLADTAYGQAIATPVQKLATVFVDGVKMARKMKNDARLISGRGTVPFEPSTGPMREALGIGSNLFRQLNALVGGSLEPSVGTARRIVMGLGSDNNMVDNIAKIAYNRGEIEPLRLGNIKKHTAVVHNGDLWMARQGIKEHQMLEGLAIPSVWIRDNKGGLIMNPYWARVNRNVTTDPGNGMMTPYVFEGTGSVGSIFREATPDDPISTRVFLNIQQPIDAVKRHMDVASVERLNADAFRHPSTDGRRRYEIINQADQAIAVNKVHRIDGNFGLRSRDVKSYGIC